MTKNTTAKPQVLRTKNEDGLPVWPGARIIDGYAYELHSTHPDMDAATTQVEAVREKGDAAQAFSSGRPKFASAGTVKGQAAFFAHAAAVYTVPAGKLGTIEGSQVTWADRPPRTPPTPPKAKKGAKKAAAAEAEKPLKQRIKERAEKETAEARAAKA